MPESTRNLAFSRLVCVPLLDYKECRPSSDFDHGTTGVSAFTLPEYLSAWSLGGVQRAAVAATIEALAGATIEISNLLAKGALAGRLGRVTARAGEFDEQKEIDLLANAKILSALQSAPVAALLSEELAEPVALEPKALLAVATDPLDGSSNSEANVSVGTIFSILPRPAQSNAATPAASFLRPGKDQLAAGFAVYGPQTVLALTVGQGTQVFTLDAATGLYTLTHRDCVIPAETAEYAINASNARHWDDAVRMYIHDCENGVDGPRAKNFNMRWTGSPVADIFRILTRGGIYLYPGDRRKGFQNGRIRLIYEANPIAWLIEQAGGRATTGAARVLDIMPTAVHEKTPLICGSMSEVERVARLYSGEQMKSDHSPLFGRRGLFRAR